MNKQAVLLLGANSDIAFALAGKFAQKNSVLILAGRNQDAVKEAAADLQIRFSAEVFTVHFDAHDYAGHKKFYEQLPLKPDVVVLAFGVLGDTERALGNWNHAEEILSANYIGAVSVLNVVAEDFQQRRQGTIIGISSVAGDRGRQSNFIYGSAKAGLTAYLSGLRNRMVKYGVHVVTVKPGFVRTKMIEGIQTSPLLTASPEAVADRIVWAVNKRKNVVYVKPIWRMIMLVIRIIPEFIFKKLSL